MSLNFYKDAAEGTKNTVFNALTMTTEGMRNMVTGSIGSIAGWARSSLFSVLKGTGNLALGVVGRSRFIALPKG